MLTVSSRSDLGTVRKINEDALVWDPEVSLLAVADGMGGHNAGEVAARMTLDIVQLFLHKSSSDKECTWPFGVDPKVSFAANRLITAIKVANRRVFRASEGNPAYTGMGTTLIAAMAEGAQLTFSSVGDSRLYIFAGGELQQLSRDDSWATLLSKESGLDVAAFEKHPMRHVLTNVVGARVDLDVSTGELDLVEGQTIMLSTDGLHGALSDDVMRSILGSEADLEQAAELLVKTAVEQDGKDNATVLLARYTAAR
jgi:protein phosphatase